MVILPLACLTWVLFAPQLSVGLLGIMLAWGAALAMCFWFLAVARTGYHTLYAGLALALLSLVILAALQVRQNQQNESLVTMLSNAVLLFSGAVSGNAIFGGLTHCRRAS
jgi:hypothetical protein